MKMEIQWDNPAHFLLDRKRNPSAVTIELFSVPNDKNVEWFDPANQTPVPIVSRQRTPMGFELLTITTMPEIVYLRFTVRYEDSNFKEDLLVINQLLWFDGKEAVGKQWDLAQWLPVLPIVDGKNEALDLSIALPRSFNFARSYGNPLVGKPIEEADKVTIKINTTWLDITNLWWKAIEKNSTKLSFQGQRVFFQTDLFNRWYDAHIQETGSRIAVVASTDPKPPLIWFVIVPEKMVANASNERIFSQVYYRPEGWRPERQWKNSADDIVGTSRVGNILAMLLWCVMSPVKVLEQAAYTADPNLIPFITDRFKLVPDDNGVLELSVPQGLWAPQRMAASVSEAGKPQIVFIPVRHDDPPKGPKPKEGEKPKGKGAPETVALAVQENLDRRLRVAASMLWAMNRLSITTLTFSYEDDFVVSGYSAGGINMWLAAEKNIGKVKALIAFEPGGPGVETSVERMRTIVDSLIKRKRKVFFVGQFKTMNDFGPFWTKTRSAPTTGITYLPPADGNYEAFFAFKPITTTNLWLRYVFTGLIKRNDEVSATNAQNPEPHPEPTIGLDERKAINKLGFQNDAGFGSKFTNKNWFGIPVLHQFAMCGGQIFTPPVTNASGIVTTDAAYKTFYQEAMEAL